MISVVVVAALAILALTTQIGVLALQRIYPAQGKAIEVAGASLNVVDIGPRDAAGPPIVMIHGASSICKRCGNRSATGLPKTIG